MKKFLCFILCLVIFTGLTSGISTFASEIASGVVDNIQWVLDSDGVLTISGTGKMNDWLETDPDWLSVQENITSVIIENGITYVGAYAFYDLENLKTITLGNSVESINSSAFSQCFSLENFYVNVDNPFFTAINGNLFSSDKTELVKYAPGKPDTSYSIPYTVTHIGNSAFSRCNNLISVHFTENITSIGDRAFSDCLELRTAYLPDSVTSIGEGAFISCPYLMSVSLGNSLCSIGEYAFSNCSRLSSIEIPSSVEQIGNSAFGNCTQLSNITVADDNNFYSSIDGSLFNKEQTKIIQYATGKTTGFYSIPDTVSVIDNGAFAYSKYLTKVNIPESVESIGSSAFNCCSSLSEIEIPDSVTYIGKGAFSICSALTDITLPSYITVIESSTFHWCDNLKSITIPNTVTEIGTYAFFWCDKLSDVYYMGTESEWNDVVIAENNPSLDSVTIHFKDDFVEPQGISLNTSILALKVGETETLIATVEPENATEKNVTWTSSDESVAVVDENGLVTAISSGDAIITASVVDGAFFAECNIHVIKLAVGGGPVISASHAKSREGKTVDVTVSIDGNEGFTSLGIELDYDDTAMTLVEISENTETGAIFTPAEVLSKKPFNMSWNSISNNTFNGTLVTLTFEISETAASGEYPISLDFYKGTEGNYIDGEDLNFDENFEPLGLCYENGSITVSRHTPGDINDDGRINEKDGTILLRYLAGWHMPNLPEEALDTNGDGFVDSKDGIHLLRFLAGWNVDIF